MLSQASRNRSSRWLEKVVGIFMWVWISRHPSSLSSRTRRSPALSLLRRQADRQKDITNACLFFSARYFYFSTIKNHITLHSHLLLDAFPSSQQKTNVVHTNPLWLGTTPTCSPTIYNPNTAKHSRASWLATSLVWRCYPAAEKSFTSISEKNYSFRLTPFFSKISFPVSQVPFDIRAGSSCHF